MAIDVISQMESDIERSKSTGGNPTFFVLKDGEKALVRCLLDLNQAAVIQKHDWFDEASQKYFVNALCATTVGLECQHCADATATNNKKLKAVRYFIIPVYVYNIKDAKTGALVTYASEGKEVEIFGFRYLQLKASSAILATLLSFYRDAGSILNNDFVIERKGKKLDTKYTVIGRAPSAFNPGDDVEIPTQDADVIIQRISDINPPKIVGQTEAPVAAPAQSNGGNGKVRTAPDF